MVDTQTQLIISYLSALEQMKTGEDLVSFFHQDVMQTEFPNKISPQKIDRNLEQILEGAERGKAIMSSQRYQLNNLITGDNNIVAEVSWQGVLRVPIASLEAGEKMAAEFACVFELKDDLIFRQRNYDCFVDF